MRKKQGVQRCLYRGPHCSFDRPAMGPATGPTPNPESYKGACPCGDPQKHSQRVHAGLTLRQYHIDPIVEQGIILQYLLSSLVVDPFPLIPGKMHAHNYCSLRLALVLLDVEYMTVPAVYQLDHLFRPTHNQAPSHEQSRRGTTSIVPHGQAK